MRDTQLCFAPKGHSVRLSHISSSYQSTPSTRTRTSRTRSSYPTRLVSQSLPFLIYIRLTLSSIPQTERNRPSPRVLLPNEHTTAPIRTTHISTDPSGALTRRSPSSLCSRGISLSNRSSSARRAKHHPCFDRLSSLRGNPQSPPPRDRLSEPRAPVLSSSPPGS